MASASVWRLPADMQPMELTSARIPRFISSQAGERNKKEKRGAVTLRAHGGIVKTNMVRLWGAPAPDLYHYLCLQMHRGKWLLFHKSAHKSNWKRRKRENWRVCCLMLLFIIYFEDLLCTTNNMGRNQIQMLYCTFTQYSMSRATPDNSIICRNPASQALVCDLLHLSVF